MKELTKFETLVYFTGATAILLAFLILKAFSISFDVWALLFICMGFVAVDILYYKAYRREKDAITKRF